MTVTAPSASVADGLKRRAARVRRGDSRLRRARDLGGPRARPPFRRGGGQDGRARLVRAPDPGGVRRLRRQLPRRHLFLEETARGQIPIGAYGDADRRGALNRFGTEQQKRDLLGHVVKGGTLAIAMSEPDSGSDVASLKTRAKRDNGEWVIDGAKMWCSYAHKASHVLIVCRTGQGERHDDMSMILVPREAEGFTITPIKTMGGEETNELHLDGVRVPEDALLGSEGGGWTQLMAGSTTSARSSRPRRSAWRSAPSTTRSLRQGAQAVRTTDRHLPGDLAQVRGPGHRPRAHAAAGALGGLA